MIGKRTETADTVKILVETSEEGIAEARTLIALARQMGAESQAIRETARTIKNEHQQTKNKGER
jgi:hypothetical protein